MKIQTARAADGAPLNLIPGTIFDAEDRHRQRSRYRFERWDPSSGTHRAFKLWNLTTGTPTEVEAEWFANRKITVISGEGAAPV